MSVDHHPLKEKQAVNQHPDWDPPLAYSVSSVATHGFGSHNNTSNRPPAKWQQIANLNFEVAEDYSSMFASFQHGDTEVAGK